MNHLLQDKYCPGNFDALDHAPDVTQFLRALAKQELPHLIIEGPRGSGKNLRTLLLLQEKFGHFSIRNIALDIPGADQKDINIMVSPFHYQINPSTHNFYDRMLIKAFTSEVLKYKILTGVKYRILVIEDADLLTQEAQESLRRTLELYISTCRFIFLVNNEGKLIDPLYSRCVKVRLPAPTEAQMHQILSNITRKEGLTVNADVLTAIVTHSKRNISKAIGYLEQFILAEPVEPRFFRREDYDVAWNISLKIITTIIEGTDIKITFDKIRELIYELITYGVEARTIIGNLLELALERLSKKNTTEIYRVCQFACERDSTVRMSSKPIYHLESFCIHLFDTVKNIMEDKKKTLGKKSKLISA
jgi:replication factor C subunit 3/5